MAYRHGVPASSVVLRYALEVFDRGSGVVGSVQCFVVDCPDIHSLAEFYRKLLGGRINARDSRWRVDETWATLHTGSRLVLAFQRVGDYRPPRWPRSTHPQQIHLDIAVDDLDVAHREALSYGATLLDAGEPTRGWRVYADPAGHPFCLIQQTSPDPAPYPDRLT